MANTTIDPEELRRLLDPNRHTDLALAESIAGTTPRISRVLPSIGDVAAPTLDTAAAPTPISAPAERLPILSTKDQRRLPDISPGTPAGSSAYYENKLTKLEAPGAAPTTTLGKVGHVLSRIGNVAGDIVAPGVMANIPGTEMFKRAEIAAIEPKLAAAKKEESEEPLKKAEVANLESEVEARRNPKPKLLSGEENVRTDAQGNRERAYELPTGAIEWRPEGAEAAKLPQVGGEATPQFIYGKPKTGTDEEQFVTKYLKDKNLPDTAENRLAAVTEYKGGAPIGDTDAKQFSTQISNVLKGTGIDAGGYNVTSKSTRGEANEALKAAQAAANEQRTRTAPEAAQGRKDARTMGYAIDEKGELKYMSKADADKIHSTFEELKPGDVNKDRQAIRQLNDVQMNTSRYRKAIDALPEAVSPLAVTNMTTILSDKGLGVKLEPFGVGIDVGVMNDAIKGTAVASAWNKLKPEERNVVIGYLRTKSSVIAYQKALTGVGRTNKEQLDIEMNNLPLPYVGATVADPQMNAWQENVDRATEGFPTNLPGIKSPHQVRKEAEGGTTHNFSVNGVEYKNVTEEDYARAKKLKGFKE